MLATSWHLQSSLAPGDHWDTPIAEEMNRTNSLRRIMFHWVPQLLCSIGRVISLKSSRLWHDSAPLESSSQNRFRMSRWYRYSLQPSCYRELRIYSASIFSLSIKRERNVRLLESLSRPLKTELSQTHSGKEITNGHISMIFLEVYVALNWLNFGLSTV
jgi:hypothetical protein